MSKLKFTEGIEKLINPITVGTLHFLQTLNETLPKSVQKKLVEKSSSKNPLMGFVVEPYCYFLCYEITDTEAFSKMLPEGFELTKAKVFDDDEEKYTFILGCFNARTSAFFGARVEAYAVAKDKNTGLTTWVIIDYDTNTISYDEKNGLSSPSCNEGFVTTDYAGRVIVDMKRNDGTNKIKFNSSIKDGKLRKLDYKLWIEGNLSVTYGRKYGDVSEAFSLRFNPSEMKEAYEIDLDNLNMEENNWYVQYLNEKPNKLVCFPYAQHFLSDAPGYYSNIKTEEELIENIESVNFSDVKVYSTDSFKKMMFLLPTTLLMIIIILILLLVFTNI